MIIDSRRYSGACPCGREHVMETRLAVVEAGCLGRLDRYLEEAGGSMNGLMGSSERRSELLEALSSA